MKHALRASLLMAATLACSVVASATVVPQGLPADDRVKAVTYNEYDVVAMKGHYGYQTTISFEPTEKIQNISIGDSISWQVVPNKVGNLLFIKPVEENAATNMTVITDRRIYNFELSSGLAGSVRDPGVTYLLKFIYPQTAVQDFTGNYPVTGGSVEFYEPTFDPARPYAVASPARPKGVEDKKAPTPLNFAYSYKGSENLKPNTTFDDGEFTYFRFRDMGDLPAIFTVDMDRNESVVNYRIEDGYMVVDGLARQYTLRHGDTESCVYNDEFNGIVPVSTLAEAS